jgi:hypothetical protein
LGKNLNLLHINLLTYRLDQEDQIMLENIKEWKTTLLEVVLAVWAAGPSLVTAFNGGVVDWSALLNGLLMVVFGALVRTKKEA